MATPAVELVDLTFSYPTIGSCTLLLGANGAGKTTLLRVLAGKHMVDPGAVSVLGEPPFHATHLSTSHRLAYIGGNWDQDHVFAGYSMPLMGDIAAGKMLENVRGVDPARRLRLVEVMDINPAWRMHLVSDGQRRRVQIAMGLLHPFDVLLLDEVTVDLDVLARCSLTTFLQEECRRRGAAVVYATHIFDGLDGWPTHLLYLSGGKAAVFDRVENIPGLKAQGLLRWVEGRLRAEKAARRPFKGHRKLSDASDGAQVAFPRNNGYAAGRINSTIR